MRPGKNEPDINMMLRFHSKDDSVEKFSCIKCSFSSPVWHSVQLHTKEVHELKEDGDKEFFINKTADLLVGSDISVKVEEGEDSEDEFDEIVGAGEEPQSNRQSNEPRKRIRKKGALDYNTCGKKLSSKHSLKNHKLRFHSNNESVEKFSCIKCSFTSPVWHSVQVHTKEVHKSKEDLYKCLLCEYCVPIKSHLLDHFMAVHQKIKDQVL